MKGAGVIPVLAAASVPLLLFGLIIGGVGLGVVAWKPPILWSNTFGIQFASNGVTAVAIDSNNCYLTSYLNSTNATPTGTPFPPVRHS